LVRVLFLTAFSALLLGAVAAIGLLEIIRRPGGLPHQKDMPVDQMIAQVSKEAAAVAEMFWYDFTFYLSKRALKDLTSLRNRVWSGITGVLDESSLLPADEQIVVVGAVPMNQGDTSSAVAVPRSSVSGQGEGLLTGVLAPDSQYAVSEWTIGPGEAGYLERVLINGQPADPGGTVAPDATLFLSGWAGDPAIGIRYSHVLVTVCGKVVATTGVGEPTPSVARFVHANLGSAGWVARLPAAALPRCPDAVLGALALRGGVVAHRLQGNFPMILQPGGNPSSAGPFAPVLRPGSIKAPRLESIRIRDRVGLRSCPDTTCPVLENIAKGPHRATLLEHVNGWRLILSAQGNGWIPKDEIEIP